MNLLVAKNLVSCLIILCLFTLNAASQQPIKNYEKEWKNVDDFMKKSLPKSALTEVKKIYTVAKKEKQSAQVIKSLLYMSSLQGDTRVGNEDSTIHEIEHEIPFSQEPATSLLNSILAVMYWNYYSEHRWQFYNRTQTTNFKKDDIATWGAEDFHKKISDLFLRSIKDEKLLQQTKLEPFDALLLKGNVRHLRPTLFDLLAHRALFYFENDERDIKKPAYAFEIEQASAFDPAADFIHNKFPTKDSLSLQHKALLIYQKILSFHINDSKPDALIDADILRLHFVNANSVHPDKDQLYFNSINHIAHQYENLPAAAQAWFLLASDYNNNANEYKPYGDSTHRLDRLKAKEICEKIVTQKDSSEGKINCYNLLSEINARSLKFSVEKVNVTGQPFRALVSYHNFNQLYLRIIKPDNKLKKALEDEDGEKYWPAIIAANPLKNWEQSLPATNDLQEHTTEIKIEALPAGEYLLVASTDKDFTSKATLLGARLFYVSLISYVSNNENFFVLNRESGEPLANASVQIWEKNYDYKTSKYIRQKGKFYKTDPNGLFRMEKNAGKNYPSNYFLDITYNNDHFFLDEETSKYFYYDEQRSELLSDEKQIEQSTFTYFFTDRGIYRPGQTVFFKGIIVATNNEHKTFLRTGYKTWILLLNNNGQLTDSLAVQTNDYGSFSGKFQLPQGVLNGQFGLQMKLGKGTQAIRVEEYKRPKFYVNYEPLKGTYKVNDKIKITGTAKAYAGNMIDGANVQYRVVRESRFPYPWLFRKWWSPATQSMEITHGEVKTDKDGKFIIEFTAIPDLKVEKKSEPIFDYTVYADVTDINGETRTGEKLVSVGYKALMLDVNIPEKLATDSLKSLSIMTQNMNGEFVPANLEVSVTKLKTEKRLIRSRYWERPDQFVMTKEEYIRNFPYDEYDNETNEQTWDKDFSLTEQRDDSSRTNGQWSIINNHWTPGFYIIEVSAKDKNGEEVKDVKYIELYDEKSNELSRPEYLWTAEAGRIEPGEKTSVKLGTAADNLFIVQYIERRLAPDQPTRSNFSFLKLNNEKKSFDFTATEADRGGYGVSYAFVKHNRFFESSQNIDVPWTNKDLAIEYATYRDKTLPGSEEKWKIRLTGYKNEKVAAEMLASMYDASLDQFYPYDWDSPAIWPYYSNTREWDSDQNFSLTESTQKWIEQYNQKDLYKEYDVLPGIVGNYRKILRGGSWKDVGSYLKRTPALQVSRSNGLIGGNAYDRDDSGSSFLAFGATATVSQKQRADTYANGDLLKEASVQELSPKQKQLTDNSPVQVRKNFNETAFFFPDLRTDSSGAIEFSFTIPEALTKWKFQALAHTKDLSFGYSSKEIVTQKQLMVQPNAPRFMREGDKMEFSAKIVNLTDKEITGQAEFQLFDATNNEPVDGRFKNVVPNQYFTVAAGQSEAVKFPMEIPYQFNKALTWRIVAKAGEISDGEEDALPVLTNRMLVTESIPLNMRGAGTKNFKFDKLINSGNSETLQNHSLTVEYTSNPAWYAVQALPYLMEYPYECAEQTWNRYYANALASMIANSSPRIKQIFEQWKTTDTAALLSNLQKNEELKSVLLEETPWVLEAKSEAEQKKNIALLFDMVKMSSQLSGSYEKLKQMQSSNGGFIWFTGGPDDRYITQYIVTGIGHLKKLNALAEGQDNKLKQILANAIPYLDKKLLEEYSDLIKYKTDLKKYTPGSMIVQYLYMRSFFPDYKIPATSQTAYTYFRARAQQTWTQQSKYMQGMLALALSRTGDAITPAAILKSLKETSISNEELGMYWKDTNRGWWWYEAPIERQSLLIEAFQEAGKDKKTADDLKTWLLKNKQTNNWESTKATAEACYALLLQGSQWLSNEPTVQIKLGNTTISSTDNKTEAGTGYFKTIIEGDKVNPQMGNISVTIESSKASPPAGGGSLGSWGSVYWQYFEDLDKITTASTPLKLVKKLFIERNSDRGPELTPVNDGDALKVGDKIKVRIELRVDRDMEYVHMKDMRAAAMEPVNVLSSYKWQDGLGYYESTKDASTNFFFSSLRKGTYVFEYPIFVTLTGNFSNGITTIQCMYAPEFSSHSEGIRINVE
jgi:uncharacterized protein YfaS (alpha-2-macroglobulin family)